MQIVRQISAKVCQDCAFLCTTSMNLGRVIKHDPESNFGSGATSDLTLGDL